MIIIISSENDQTTHNIIDYLWKAKASFRVVNQHNSIKKLSIHLSNNKLDVSLDNNSHQVFWYRRGDLFYKLPLKSTDTNAHPIGNYLGKEWERIRTFLHWNFEENHSLGSFDKEVYNNKIWDLSTAQQLGLLIPETLVTTNKKELQQFKDKYSRIISKPIHQSFAATINNTSFNSEGTQLVTQDHIDQLDDNFFPILVQKCLDKVFELRVFYFNGQCFPMAIFSQNNDKTLIDYRYYDRQKPNRNVPFLLPKEIETKVHLFMKKSNLDTGSIDIVVTKKEEYVFLEVNPVGQFGWVSSNCNYYLEEKVANYLMNNTSPNSISY